MSVRWMRTAQIGKGMFMEAIAWTKEVSAYLEKKHGFPKIHTWIDSFGALGTIRWTTDYPDLAAVEKAQMQIMGDPDYWKMIKKAVDAELFIEGSVDDHVSREV